ncbi:hypothetical protein ABGB16_29955 [Micromonospora sp. B11E3]|uniref:hypothetical protein n=1 Tax=unclassified Micromonospora TaxID=2617518 RepID=UPI00325DF670
MMPLHAQVLAVDSPPRRAIYSRLLNEGDRTWTVAELATALPLVSVEAIRTTVHLLIGERFLDLVPRSRSLTVQLTDNGTDALREILASWSEQSNAARVEEPS